MPMFKCFSTWSQHLITAIIFSIATTCSADVKLLSHPPGKAYLFRTNNLFALENSVISAKWEAMHGKLMPINLRSKITGQECNQIGAELYRISLAPLAMHKGVSVAVRMEADRVMALASNDGSMWTELASFPRDKFPGEPIKGSVLDIVILVCEEESQNSALLFSGIVDPQCPSTSMPQP